MTETPLLTADLPGVGGRIKVEPEDFEVEEIPAYAPSGEGEFLYLWVEKRDMGASYFVGQLAQRLGVPRGEIGSAGLKDRRAITRQWVSAPIAAEPRVGQVDGDGLRVLDVKRHGNKLRPGHLHGNRFRIRVRDASHLERVAPIVERLRTLGLPNVYGPQRFGRGGETLRLGEELLAGKPIRNPFLKKLAISAVQSDLFNAVLAKRMADGLLRVVLPGDVMGKLPYGGIFTAEDVPTEQARFDRREIVTQGPMFGVKMFPSKAEAAVREAETLAARGLNPRSFAGFGKLAQGTRRHNLVYLDDLTATIEGADLNLAFTLPAGSYATVLLTELTKTATTDDDADPE